MRLAIRFLMPLFFALALLAYGSVFAVEKFTLVWFLRDLNLRAQFTATAIHDSLVRLMRSGSREELGRLLQRVTRDERVYAIALCAVDSTPIFQTPDFPAELSCRRAIDEEKSSYILELPSGSVQVSRVAIEEKESLFGSLIVVHDMRFAIKRRGEMRKYVFFLFLVIGLVVSSITVIIARLSWKGWVRDVRFLIREKGVPDPDTASASSMPEMLPVLKELRELLNDVEADRKFQHAGAVVWTPATLKEVLVNRLAGEDIVIVANREPYIHNRKNGEIEVQIPASGLVTALEPVMKACSGTWIAHGSGSADREVVDDRDRIFVPPGESSYQLRRVWMNEEEENGYYYGFANEGIWPLCHIAHTRPVFRSKDWEYYRLINSRFAQAVFDEVHSETPVILVQDYHFSVLPALLRKQLPNAIIITFWHIPWPNPEAFGICPWRREILEGMLGSTILGFHTRLHANNFLETVDRFVECRIDHARSAISYKGDLTSVRNYPISIAWPPKYMDPERTQEICRTAVIERHKLKASVILGIGVDRLDYTKGILERFLAVERLMELFPHWRGKFTFIQIAAPSRSKLEAYRQLQIHVHKELERINSRFAIDGAPPILFLEQHHSPQAVSEYLRAGQVCLVTSLHDGMNLVAKEFIAARDDGTGVLMLSIFTGASRELPEALIVNPYDIDQCAQAINFALRMPEAEQRHRIQSMREQIEQFNIYRWAGRMLIDAAQVRKKDQLSRAISEFGDDEDMPML